MKFRIETTVSFDIEADADQQTVSADTEEIIYRALRQNDATDIILNTDVEALTFLCPRCGNEQEDYEMDIITGYYGRDNSERFCESCRDAFDTILARAQDRAHEEAEYTFEQEGSW